MNITIIGASGATGQLLTRQALERGHSVTAISRHPEKIDLPDSDHLTRIPADVLDPESIGKALEGSTIIISGLGVSKDEKTGVLTAGAQAIVAAKPRQVVWLGGFGTGELGAQAGFLTRTLLSLFMGKELEDKVTADTLIRKSGGTVFHAGQLVDKPLSQTRRTVPLDKVPRRIWLSSVSRATVAEAMLDEAEKQTYSGHIVVPLDL